MFEIIYFILSIILIIILLFEIILLKNNNKFLTKSVERNESAILEFERKLKETEETLKMVENDKLELSIQLRVNKELLLDQREENENLLKLISELQKAKPHSEEDVIIEYFLKTKK